MNVRIQCAAQTDAVKVFDQIKSVVQSISDSGVKAELEVKRAHHQFLPNVTAMKAVYRNMELLGPITYTPEEMSYAFQLQEYLGSKKDTLKDFRVPFSDGSNKKEVYGYSSDIGEASWFAPEIYFVVTCLPTGVNMHQWSGTALTAHSIGHKGMIQAAKIMAMTIVDYIQKPELRSNIRKEFEESTRIYKYQSLIK